MLFWIRLVSFETFEKSIYSYFFGKFDVKAYTSITSLLFDFILTVLENLLKFFLIHRQLSSLFSF